MNPLQQHTQSSTRPLKAPPPSAAQRSGPAPRGPRMMHCLPACLCAPPCARCFGDLLAGRPVGEYRYASRAVVKRPAGPLPDLLSSVRHRSAQRSKNLAQLGATLRGPVRVELGPVQPEEGVKKGRNRCHAMHRQNRGASISERHKGAKHIISSRARWRAVCVNEHAKPWRPQPSHARPGAIAAPSAPAAACALGRRCRRLGRLCRPPVGWGGGAAAAAPRPRLAGLLPPLHPPPTHRGRA